jgi:hypothetical protein
MTSGGEKNRFRKPLAEEMRLRACYRRFVLAGGTGLPNGALKGLTGPDCAYRLYGRTGKKKHN